MDIIHEMMDHWSIAEFYKTNKENNTGKVSRLDGNPVEILL